jgi:site-specific recombinase XerD
MTFKTAIDKYIEFRNALGNKMDSSRACLLRLLQIVGDIDINDIPTDQWVTFIVNSGTHPKTMCGMYSIFKGFCHWAYSRDYMKLLPNLLHPYRQQCDDFIPYIYSDDEIKMLFNNALKYPQYGRCIHDGMCIRTILQLTYFLGLRINETLSLHLADINIDQRYIVVRETKFYKSRIVPFNHQIADLIMSFMDWRGELEWPDANESYLFYNRDLKPIRQKIMWDIFNRLRKMSGLTKRTSSKYYPRIHDLRHTFITNRIIRWYQEGVDVSKNLVYLSTYVGHVSIKETAVYISMTPVLLGEAGKRFENYIMSALKLKEYE